MAKLNPIPGLLPEVEVASKFRMDAEATVFAGDCMDLLRQIPDGVADLVVTSPPYNIGKKYEKRLDLDGYIADQACVIRECVRTLSPSGNICWQIGNYVDYGAIIPLDIVLFPIFAGCGLRMRNRIVWHFEHGLHCSKRLSGRYEVIIWFTKSDDYIFDVDMIRVPQKYPEKRYFKGPKAGQYSCNPMGKNPGDIWTIPNVKHNHVEKTAHPCQFPVELVERLVLSMSRENGLVIDPYLGAGSTAVAALRHHRRVAGADTVDEYCRIARERIALESLGLLRTRPMSREIYSPPRNSAVSQNPFADENGGTNPP